MTEPSTLCRAACVRSSAATNPLAARAKPVVVCLASPKGGVGKSTTAVGLLGAARQRGLQCLLIDADEAQHSAKQWLPEDPDVAALSARDALARLGSFQGQLIVIDTPGVEDPLIDRLLLAADIVVIPMSDSMLDVRPTSRLYIRLLKAKANPWVLFANVDRPNGSRVRRSRDENQITKMITTVVPRRMIVRDAVQARSTFERLRDRGAAAFAVCMRDVLDDILAAARPDQQLET